MGDRWVARWWPGSDAVWTMDVIDPKGCTTAQGDRASELQCECQTPIPKQGRACGLCLAATTLGGSSIQPHASAR